MDFLLHALQSCQLYLISIPLINRMSFSMTNHLISIFYALPLYKRFSILVHKSVVFPFSCQHCDKVSFRLSRLSFCVNRRNSQANVFHNIAYHRFVGFFLLTLQQFFNEVTIFFHDAKI